MAYRPPAGAVGRDTVVARTVRDLEGTVPVTGWEIESVARRWNAVQGSNFERHSRDEAAIISCAFWGIMRHNCHMRRHAKSQVATRRKSEVAPWVSECGRQYICTVQCTTLRIKKIDTWCSLLHFMKFAQCVSQRRHGPVILLIVTVMSTLP